MFVQIIESVE